MGAIKQGETGAIERLESELAAVREREAATAEILKVISRSRSDVQPVFDAIAESALRLLRGWSAHVCTYDGEQLHFGAARGARPDSERFVRNRYPALPNPDWMTGRCILACAAVNVADCQADRSPAQREFARQRGYRGALAVPMLRDGKPVGAVAVTREAVGAFADHEVQVLATFAEQAVIAIEKVRLFHETKEALEQQTAISAILGVISASPSDVAPVLDAVVERAMSICESGDARIFLVDGDRLRNVAGRGEVRAVDKGDNLPLERGLVMGRAVIDKRPIHVEDLANASDPDYALGSRVARQYGFRTTLAVPLLREQQALGAILLRRMEVRPFTEKQIALLKTFAEQAAIAIENVRVFHELETRTQQLSDSVRQLTALGEVGQAISSTLDLEAVLRTIVSRALQLTGLDAGEIFEYDEHAQRFYLRAVQNLDEGIVEAVRREPLRKGEGAIGRTAITGEPTEIPDILEGSYRSSVRALLAGSGIRALLAVPLKREQRLLGALVVNRKAPGRFARETVELLRTFATQSAVAIQNARLFREIESKSRQLEEASRHKSQFLARMSHELRTPLNAILGFNEMMLDEIYGPVPSDMKEPLEETRKSGKHLLGLINNVLDLAKIEAGRMELALGDYAAQDVVQGVGSALRPLAVERGLVLVASSPEDLPLAHGDAGRLTQCLLNLVGNSLKFTRQGGVEISVALREDRLVYRVADTGIGIPGEKMQGLFTEFKQTDPTIASEYGGTGLGLAISRKFVEMHGGRIWAESEPGKGSTFSFEVPLRCGGGAST